MRQPPPVAVTCSGGGCWRVAQAALLAAAAAAATAWAWLQLRGPLLPAGLAAVAVALLAGVARWRSTPPRALQLRWDGQAWSVDGQPGDVDVMLDLQRWMLLRYRPRLGRTRWLPLGDAAAGRDRHALRAALYSRALPIPPDSPVV